jgi:CheY-like chemotaxis protein
LVAKILVADDNSNIQKMVGLALKDQGIDVVAVGNGEAAVRKISDVHPDLVLADVFMPVRNGYEVCQYVKGDSSLAHIPVILLVGAFDPLDEQEAQRVGADGVLKKPFVPPDPLISMVKSALTRAGVSIGGAPPAPVVKEEPLRAVDMLTPRTPPSSISLPALEGFPNVESEPVAEEMPSRPQPVRIDSGSQPLAFGSLLETPTEQEQEEDLGYATTARPELERDWKSGQNEEEEVEDEEEEKPSSSWRRDAADESVEAEQEAGSQVKDWREAAFGETAPAARKSKVEAWTPQKEIAPFEEAAEAEESVSAVVAETPLAEIRREPVPIAPAATTLTPTPMPISTTYAPAAETTLEREPVAPAAPTVSVKPTPVTATLTPVPESPFSQDAWAAALREPAALVSNEPAEEPAAPFSAYSQDAVTLEGRDEAPAGAAPVIEMPAPSYQPPKAPTADSWFSAVSSPWDAEVQKANQLASTWDLPASSPAKGELKPDVVQAAPEAFASLMELPKIEDPLSTVDALPSSLSPEVREKVEEAALPVSTVEAIREETQQVTDTVVLPRPAVSAPATAEPAKPATPAPGPAQASMEELVAKVLAQMSPEVLQAVTREILKPVVEAMVRDELNGKKS